MMKRSSKSILSLLILICLVGLLAGLYLSSRPEPVSGTKAITVTVVHSDKTERQFHFHSEKEFLGDLLLAEGVIKGDLGPYGLYITEVDGEVANYSLNNSYWALFDGDSYATQGADTTPLTDGSHFRLVYTHG